MRKAGKRLATFTRPGCVGMKDAGIHGAAVSMGALRLYLAVCVFLWHCWMVQHHHALASFAAVYCFFIMSGFYISMALDQTYPDTPNGTLRFYANRALRLYPTYLVVLVATAIAYRVGLISYGVPGISGHSSFWGAFNQITVLPKVAYLTLSATAATGNTFGPFLTVGIEMMFYALAPFFVRWKLPNLILLFVASGIVHFIPYMLGLPDRQWQYEFFPSTAVLFVAGSLSYRLYVAIKDTANRYVGWIALPGIIAYGVYFDPMAYTNTFEPIVLYAAFSLMLPFLFIASQQPRIKKIDKFLGDISYPIYVVHILAIGIVDGTKNVTTALALTVGLSVALLLIERPVEWIRDGIRSRNNALSAAKPMWRKLCALRLRPAPAE